MKVCLTPLSQVSTVIMAAICVAAMILGRWPERWGAVVIALDWLASALGEDRRWRHHGQPVTFASDLIMLATFVGLTLGCRRTWVLWAAASALLMDATHVAALLDPAIGQWSYITAVYVWEFTLLAALAVGTILEGRRTPGPPVLGLRRRSTPL